MLVKVISDANEGFLQGTAPLNVSAIAEPSDPLLPLWTRVLTCAAVRSDLLVQALADFVAEFDTLYLTDADRAVMQPTLPPAIAACLKDLNTVTFSPGLLGMWSGFVRLQHPVLILKHGSRNTAPPIGKAIDMLAAEAKLDASDTYHTVVCGSSSQAVVQQRLQHVLFSNGILLLENIDLQPYLWPVIVDFVLKNRGQTASSARVFLTASCEETELPMSLLSICNTLSISTVLLRR